MYDLHNLLGLAPNARQVYREAFAWRDLLAEAGFVDRPLRVAHFFAQILHETAGLTLVVENLNYRAERIEQLGQASPPGSRWRSLVPRSKELAGNPRGMANAIYGGRLGNVDPDDGWRYRGRGLPQLTGRDAYAHIGAALGLDLVGQPDLAISAEHMLMIAIEVWRWKRCDAPADADDVVRVTRAINGGTIGLADRRVWLVKTKAVCLDPSIEMKPKL